MSKYGSDSTNPNYVETRASLKRKTKEDIRIDSLIPEHILTDAENTDGSPNIKTLLEKYYKFMNMDEFIYTSEEIYTDQIASDKAVFRILDPNNENNKFFGDYTGGSSTLTVLNTTNNQTTTVSLSSTNVSISNGNELPGSLLTSTNPYGKTFTVSGLSGYGLGSTATLTTPQTNWVGPGPSYVLNAIEEAMNIDYNGNDYLELMQKEIAAMIPRDLSSVEKRSLYKNITEFYKLKGSQDSIEIFFRLLFDEEVEVDYPWDKTLIPSSGDWDAAQNRYLDHKGFLSNNIKLQDSKYWQKFSYNIKTGRNLSDWAPAFDRLVHPAGFVFFGQILILTQLTRAVLGDNVRENSIGTETTTPVGEVKVPNQTGKVYNYKDLYNRTNRKTLSSMPGLQPGVIGAEDVALLVEMFASTFLPNIIAKINKSATFSITVSGGKIATIEAVNKGYGYQSAPTTANGSITVTGNAGSSLGTDKIVTTLDSHGSIDKVELQNSGGVVQAGGIGSGYTTAYASPAAAPDVGKVTQILLSNLADKTYTTAPVLTFDEPTSVDADGNPLSTNVTATATVQLYADGHAQAGEISGFTITEDGNGYTTDPVIRISSPTNSEERGKDVKEIAIIMLNHVANIDAGPWSSGFKTLSENDYFQNKKTYYSTKKFRDDYPIEFFSDKIIGSTYESSINKYNVKTNINQE